MKTGNYGWHSPDPTISVDYCTRAIIKQLAALHCRKVLDVGSGNGAMTALVHNAGFEIAGMEPDQIGVEIARKANPDIPFYAIGVYDDTSALGQFDAVISSEVIEHLFDPAALLQVAKKHLKAGGYLLLTCPHHAYIKNLLISLTNKWDLHFHPQRLGGHIKFWSHRSMKSFLEAHGFEVKIMTGAGRFWPVWKSMVVVARMS
jgi:2-polyprenyl-3-methyl-5-hydroxy-6-metoxy-1,4-benzoquinol methylase